MSDITTFEFNKSGFDKIKSFPLGTDWPVVYIIEGGRDAYVGETTNARSRSTQHIGNPDRAKLKNIHLITDDEYNKSATLDMESLLIQYISAEGSLKLQNGNRGLANHNYYDKPRYRGKFEALWDKLKGLGLVAKDLNDIKNSEMFKYSPYKALTPDQLEVAEDLESAIKTSSKGIHIVNGGPGTGKTVLATYLAKALKEGDKTKHLAVGLVVPMTSLRKSIQEVFSKIEGLSRNMVIGPSGVGDKKYDILIVDEAHRLRQRRNLTNYSVHDAMNKKLGLTNDGTELDWILRHSNHQILFYDENQTIRPTDVRVTQFKGLNATHHHLSSQLRVSGGDAYIRFIEKIFAGENASVSDFSDFEFKIYDDASKMISDIKAKDSEFGLSRVVAGYAWPWVTRDNPNAHDIEIDGLKLKWNSTTTDWVNSPNALNEVGCIHTVQGYDLNYVGVIVGPELAYDSKTNKLIINPDKYEDRNGWRGVDDPKELERYIMNIYKTLMTRGIRGCYVYFVDKETEKYFKDRIGGRVTKSVLSPFTKDMIRIPIVGSAPCGNPLLGEENVEDYVMVEKAKIKPGFEYFVLRAEGDSMNLAGIDDGDLVLCRQQLKGETGQRVVALLGDNVTIKMYDKKDGRRILLPKSSNKTHQPIIPDDGDTVQGVVQEVIEPNSI